MNEINESGRLANPGNIPVWPTALRYGGITGLVLVIMGLVLHLTDMNNPAEANPAFGCLVSCLTYAILGTGIVLAIKYHRDKELGGAITLGRGFGMGAATTLIVVVITTIWTILLMAVIAPETSEMMREAMLKNAQPGQEEMMETIAGIFGSPIGAATMGFFLNGIFGVIVSLIAAAIMKKDPLPNV